MQRLLELALIPFLRLVLLVFFRRIELSGEERIPPGSALIYTPNHVNSLLDGILARVFLPRDPRPLARATLWDITFLRPLLVAARAIPVYRQQDETRGEDRAALNRGMFDACYEALARGDCIVLFPEGESHSQPALLPLKTGAARIALGAEQQRGPLALRIVPVGMNFDARDRFRSRVLICVGEPVDPMEGLDSADAENREAVEGITARIEQGLKAVTLNYPSWEEANIIRRAADLYASQRRGDAKDGSLTEAFSVNKQLADAYLVLKDTGRRRVRRLVEAVNAYDRLLRVLSIRHEHVIQEHPELLKSIYSFHKLTLFLVRLPLALLGLFLNAVPFYLVRLVSRIKVRPDRASTTKIVAGLILFPLCWTLQAMYLGEGLLPSWVWWLLAPLSGVSTLLFRERHAQLLEELRTYLRLRTHSDIREELEQRLENINLEIEFFLQAAALKMQEPGPPETPAPAAAATMDRED